MGFWGNKAANKKLLRGLEASGWVLRWANWKFLTSKKSSLTLVLQRAVLQAWHATWGSLPRLSWLATPCAHSRSQEVVQFHNLNGKWQVFLQDSFDVGFFPCRGQGEITPSHSTASDNAPPSSPSCLAPATPLQSLPTSIIQGSGFSPAWSFVSCP